MSLLPWQIWLVIATFFAIIEIVSTTFYMLWFAIGAVFASICALLGLNLYLQGSCFLLVSLALVIFTRPLVNSFIKEKEQDVKTNVEKLVGQVALVLEEINPEYGNGLVKIGGDTWSAISSEKVKISKGSQVRVLRIEGVKVIVERIEEKEGKN